jgi:hypothetical protein
MTFSSKHVGHIKIISNITYGGVGGEDEVGKKIVRFGRHRRQPARL